MTNIPSALSSFKKLAIIGVGNELRRDDAVGLVIANRLKEQNRNPKIEIFLGGTTPENLIGPLRRSQPSHLLLIDAAQTGRTPGDFAWLNPAELGGETFSTHTFSLQELAKYLAEELKTKVLILGVEPQEVSFGEGLSAAVEQAVPRVVLELQALLQSR